MKESVISCLILVALSFTVNVQAEKKTERVVVIALDGISVEGLKKAYTPNLDTLMANGVFSLNTRVVMPSVTLPNWTSHLTGSGPEQHGVVDNDWQLEKYALHPVTTDSKGYYPSVYKVLKDHVRNVKTAFYYNWKNLIYPYNQDYIDQVSFQENDGYVENYQKALAFITENKDKPTFVFLYSVHTDHAGHNYGWMSPEYIRSIEEADVQIGKFLDSMKREGLYNSTHFIFTSDHGGINKGHVGVTVNEMEVPWSITGPRIPNGQELKEPNNTVNTAAVILKLFKSKAPLCWTGEIPSAIFRQ